MKALLALTLCTSFASMAMAADTPAVAKPDPAKGQAAAAACVACHAVDGSRGVPANPILAGQHPEYLAKQLAEFKSGKRDNAIMKGMAAIVADDDIKHVAAYFTSLKTPAGTSSNKDLVGLGEKIYRGGIAGKQVPACAGCHSPNGAGIPAQYPRLAGQHAEYTEAQMVAFRGGMRGNSAQMSAIAAKLSDREIKAVADYVAGLR